MMNTTDERFGNFVDVDQDADKNDNLDLIPDECFVADNNADKSKKFTCKQCAKEFKSAHGVKQHVAAMHKAKKRGAENTGNPSKKYLKKAFIIEDFDPIGTSTQGDATSAFCKEFLDDGDLGEHTFSLDLSIENLVQEKAMHSTAISDEDDDDLELSPDQDHNTLVKEDNEAQLMKAKIISLQIAMVRKETDYNEKVNELNLAKGDIEELSEKMHDVKKEKDEKEEALDIATGKLNSVEEEKLNLLKKLRLYSATIKKYREQATTDTDDRHDEESAKDTVELKKNLKEKNKKLKEAESRARKLADKLSEIESKMDEDEGSIDDKYRKVNEKLTGKIKDLKKVQQQLKQAETKAKNLLETVTEKNKKISQLDNENTRLKSMNEHANEIINKSSKVKEVVEKKEKVEEKTIENKKKCRYENTGVCRANNECKDLHPKKTCQSFSKLGSCPLESSCEHRHPFGVCYNWEKYGSCTEGDKCRHRHPFDLAIARQSTPDPFLSHSSPSNRGMGEQNQGGQWTQGQAHRDQRGNRW